MFFLKHKQLRSKRPNSSEIGDGHSPSFSLDPSGRSLMRVANLRVADLTRYFRYNDVMIPLGARLIVHQWTPFIFYKDNNPHRGLGPLVRPRCATRPEPVRQNPFVAVSVAIDIRGLEGESGTRMSDSGNYRNLKVISVWYIPLLISRTQSKCCLIYFPAEVE